MTKECELLLAIATIGKIAVVHITLLKKFTYRGTSNRQILKQRPPHSITKSAR
jgi:hypothetical protein